MPSPALVGYPVAHFGHLLTFNCSNFTWNGKRLEQTVNNEGKSILEPFSKEFEVLLLYSIKTVISHLKDRFNEHRRPVDRPTPSSRPTAVSDHFLSDNQSPNDIELVPLELIHSSRDTLLKAREAYLVERGQTLKPKGITKLQVDYVQSTCIPFVLYSI